MTDPKPVRIVGEYLGGHPQHPRKSVGVMTLHLTTYGAVVKGMKNRVIDIKADQVTGVRVEADAASARRGVGTVLTLGAGALLTRKHIKECFLVVSTTDGDVILHVKKPPMEIQGKVAPFTLMYDQRVAAMEVAPPAPDLADQIKKLAELNAAGVLTDEEFSAKKAELLARM